MKFNIVDILMFVLVAIGAIHAIVAAIHLLAPYYAVGVGTLRR